MSFWTAIVAIVFICTIGEAIRSRRDSKHDAAADEKLDEISSKLDRLDGDLRARVEVLERIVTDRKDDLKSRIDELRRAS